MSKEGTFVSEQGEHLVKSKDSSVIIQTSSQPVPSTPSWLGEVAVIAQYLRHIGVLTTIGERVRFARRRFGYYDVIDFVVVLLGYAHARRTHVGGVL
jgi:hypothetical protein